MLLVLIFWYLIDEHGSDKIFIGDQQTPSVHYELEVIYMCVNVLCMLLLFLQLGAVGMSSGVSDYSHYREAENIHKKSKA